MSTHMYNQDVPTYTQSLVRDLRTAAAAVLHSAHQHMVLTLVEMISHVGIRECDTLVGTIEYARVRLDHQGYATRSTYASPGSYWGVGPKLWVVWVHDPEQTRTYYIRAEDHKVLKHALANIFRSACVLEPRGRV